MLRLEARSCPNYVANSAAEGALVARLVRIGIIRCPFSCQSKNSVSRYTHPIRMHHHHSWFPPFLPCPLSSPFPSLPLSRRSSQAAAEAEPLTGWGNRAV